MTPPPIRYPLPMLAAVLLLGFAAWRGADSIGAARRAVAAAVKNRLDPPAPRSSQPKRYGPFVWRVLLLREGAEVRDEPEGPVIETIDRRGFFDLYDGWKKRGGPAHVRIGNRRAIGWVRADDLLEWSTRLVLVDGEESSPVVGREGDTIQLARWREGEEWSVVDRWEWMAADEVGSGSWAVWMSRDELLALLAECVAAEAVGGLDAEARMIIRARAVAGLVLSPHRITADEARAILAYLPRELPVAADDAPEPSERLARLNENWKTEAAWSGLTFRAVPLPSLP